MKLLEKEEIIPKYRIPRGKNSEKSYIFRTPKPSGLVKILEPEYSIGIWNRNPSLGLQEEMKLVTETSWNIREEIQSHKEISQILPSHIPIEFPEWFSDLEFLVEMFSDLLETQNIGFRLVSLDKAMCPKFHTDYVGIRLLCTYVGQGTEFLENTIENRGILGHAHPSHCAESLEIRNSEKYDVVLLKGENWEGNKGKGAIHRSPNVPIGQTRIVLSLDAL